MDPSQPQPAYAPPNNDAEHLRLLSIFHYIFAGLTALFSFFPIIYVVIGIGMMSAEFPAPHTFPEHVGARNAAPQDDGAQKALPDDAPPDAAHPGLRQGGNAQPEVVPKPPTQPKDALPVDDVRDGDELPFPDEELRYFGIVFATIGIVMMLFGWTYAVLLVVAGRKLAAHRGRTFCVVIAAISCCLMPLGTVLGVFTIIVLMRPSVQALFEAPSRMQAW